MDRVVTSLSKVFTVVVVVLFLSFYAYVVQKWTDGSDEWIKFLAFSSQLIMGGYAYDAFRVLPTATIDWKASFQTMGKFFVILIYLAAAYIAAFAPGVPELLRWLFFIMYIVGSFWAATEFTSFLKIVKKGFPGK